MTELSIIAAMDENRLIGRDNGLPWHLPADLRFFRETTMGKPIVMGRKTQQSIGRPLPGRRNIVVTRDPGFSAEGCEIVPGIDAALALCAADEEVMLIGGASLYEQTLERATRLYITLIHHRFEGDTWFPEFDRDAWSVAERSDFEPDSSNPYAYSLIKFVREI